MPKKDAFSCASLNEEAVCTCNCISWKQRASHLCVRAYESSDCLKLCKLSCTDCIQTVFLQKAAACVSSDYQHCCMNYCTGHSWNASPLNVLSCAVGGDHLLCRNRGMNCNRMVFFPWMSEQVLLEITHRCAGILALFATIGLFPWVGSHMDSKGTSFIARIVALCRNKRLLSALNHHVGF